LDRFYATLHAIQEELKKPVSATPSIPSPSTGEKYSSSPSPFTGEGKACPEQSRRGGGVHFLEEARKTIKSFQARFEEAMDDDFNTAQALGYFYDLQTCLNGLLGLPKGEPNVEIRSLLNQGNDHFSKMGWVLGLFLEEPGGYMERQRKKGVKKLSFSEEEILNLIEERNQARKNKDWKKADEIRNSLLSKGIVLEDMPGGTLWKIK
jgi:cysteinyl-tRNA synthetase